jgi:hypothetical protein
VGKHINALVIDTSKTSASPYIILMENTLIIQQTKKWIKDVVIGLNFCPFANKEYKNNTIRYQVSNSKDMSEVMMQLFEECVFLDLNEETSTTLLILSEGFQDFEEYLFLVDLCEKLLRKQKYEGVYQIATFHPEYVFDGEDPLAPANFTNRSIYPMLHLLREEQLEEAIENFPDTELIPEKNIEVARKLGLEKLQALRAACHNF